MEKHASSQASTIPVWLEDVNRAAQYLTRLSLESAAQAALIMRAGQVWAYASHLPQTAIAELSRATADNWSRDNTGDLARFVRLDSEQRDFLVYATNLVGDMLLALVFDVETPFTKIRTQAVRLARLLSTPPQSEEQTGGNDPSGAPLTPGAPPQSIETASAARPLLFEDVPPPSPVGEPDKNATPPLAVTQPPVVSTSAAASELTPDILSLSELYLASILIPRLPSHQLTGDLANKLSGWVGQLCLAFGWKLEHLVTRPESLQWVVRVSPTVQPKSMLRHIRQHTSQRIFEEFPRFRSENPSGDFWAPGYLITNSQLPLADPVVRSFIQQMRNFQGVQKPAGS